MENIKQYHLHKYDHTKFQFEVYNANEYFLNNKIKASKPHRHSYYQLIYFTTPGKHYIDYEVIEHPEETFFFINKNQIHYFCKESLNEGLLFHFNDMFLNQFNKDLTERYSLSIFNEIGHSFIELSEKERMKVKSIISFIIDELDAKGNYYKDKVFHYFQTILIDIERLKGDQNLGNVKVNDDFILAISFKKLIQNQIAFFTGIEKYASDLNTNTKNLTSVSKKYFNKTPAELVKDLKVLEAKRLLANQKINIKEVAYHIGFEQPTYFTKYFKKATGLTPKEFQSSLL